MVPSSALRPLGHQPPQGTPSSRATSRAARSAPLWPPDTSLPIMGPSLLSGPPPVQQHVPANLFDVPPRQGQCLRDPLDTEAANGRLRLSAAGQPRGDEDMNL